MFFHAGFETLPGGFVGVDVFFVISGYLITSLIYTELCAGRFELLRFYERRIRRIFPALVLVVASSAVVSYFVLLPQDHLRFSQSVVAVVLFVSNIFFWQESGYFETASEMKPLIHTWSLAIEEQFYLLFPLAMLLLWRFGSRVLLPLMLAAVVAGLLLAQWASVNSPSASFFLLPTRAWELLAGSAAAFVRPRSESYLRGDILTGIGLLMIATAVVSLDERTPFPGFATLLPVAGAALVVIHSAEARLFRAVLSHRWVVGVGLISYGAYLWHQPIIAFYRHETLLPVSAFGGLSLVLFSLALAALSWKFLEVPIRRRLVLPRMAVFGFGFAFMLGLGLIGWHGHVSQGYPGRDSLDPDRTAYLAYFDNAGTGETFAQRRGHFDSYRRNCDFYEVERSGGWTEPDSPSRGLAPDCVVRNASPRVALLWGDSHVQMLNAGLQRHLGEDWQLLQIATSSCWPRIVASGSGFRACERSNELALDVIEDVKPDVVVVAQLGGHELDHMRVLHARLTALGAGHVLFVGPAPRWVHPLPTIVARKLWPDVPLRSFVGVDARVLATDRHIRAGFDLSRSSSYASLADYFCDSTGCLTRIGDDIREGAVTFDNGHLTAPASKAFARDVLAPAIEASAHVR
jgi:peptidoglycan/LPS O-acetylase OafA/YrhL